MTVTTGSSFARRRESSSIAGTNSTDAEQLLAYHALAPGVQRRQGRLNLPKRPGVRRCCKLELLRTWRRGEMAMPPRGADLWRDARGLGLYGDGDEDEVRAMGDGEAREEAEGLAALTRKGEGGRSGGAMTIEEELLLTDEARDPAEAVARLPARIGVDLRLLDDDGDEYHGDDGGEYHGGGGRPKHAACSLEPRPSRRERPALDHHRRSPREIGSSGRRRVRTRTSPAAPTIGTRRTQRKPGSRDSRRRDAKRRGPRGAERRRRNAATALRSARAFFERARPRPGFRPARPLPPSQGEAHVGVLTRRGTF